jgi:IS1 family transposase
LTMLERSSTLSAMNVTDSATKATVIRCLIDGMGIRAASRLTGVAKGTVLRILAEAGEFCGAFQDRILNRLPTTRVEVDEQWSFCGAKQRNAKSEGQGDLWTYAAIDAESKLICCWLVGGRTPENTNEFIADLASRVVNRIQLSADGYGAYVTAVRLAFAFGRVDFAQIVKELGQTNDTGPSRRYSPPVVIGVKKVRVIGRPDMSLVSTSYVERLNLATRNHCKRFARLTSAHSRKAENHVHAINLNFFAHNFIRVHSTLTKEAGGRKMTPAMCARLTDHVWTVEELVAAMDPKSVTVK